MMDYKHACKIAQSARFRKPKDLKKHEIIEIEYCEKVEMLHVELSVFGCLPKHKIEFLLKAVGGEIKDVHLTRIKSTPEWHKANAEE